MQKTWKPFADGRVCALVPVLVPLPGARAVFLGFKPIRAMTVFFSVPDFPCRHILM